MTLVQNLKRYIDEEEYDKVCEAVDLLETEISNYVPSAQLEAAAKIAEAHYRIGRFEKVVELVEGKSPNSELKFPQLIMVNYVRSKLAVFLGDLKARKAPLEIPQHIDTLSTSIVEAVCFHFLRNSEARDKAVKDCLDEIKSSNFLSPVLHLLHFYSLPVDGDEITQVLERVGVSEKPGFLGLANLLETNIRNSKGIQSIFCSGTARAGTTALGNMLNVCPDVAMFTELFSPHYGYSSKMFEDDILFSDRFEKHVHGANNVKTRDAIGPDLKYIGDKRPLFFNSWNITKNNYDPSDLKIINIIREPQEVLASYEKRSGKAKGLKDRWLPDRSSIIAECDMSTQLEVIRDIEKSEFKSSLKLVNYPDALTEFEVVAEIFDFLEVPLKGDFKADVEHQVSRNNGYMRQKEESSKEIEFQFLTKTELGAYRKILESGVKSAG